MGNGVYSPQKPTDNSNDDDLTGPAWTSKLEEVFDRLDFDKDGCLDWEEIQGYFQRLNSKTARAETDAAVKTAEFMWTFDINGDEKISLNEFKKACQKSTNRFAVMAGINEALLLLRKFEDELKKDHVLYASFAHPLSDTRTTTRSGLNPCETDASDAVSEQLWDIYVADDESGERCAKGIRVTANPIGSTGLERQDLRTSMDQLKTLVLYLTQFKVPCARELLDKLQQLQLLDDKRNFSAISSVLDADDCAHLGKCVVDQLCWNKVASRLEYQNALEISTMNTSKAIRISCSPSLQRLFPNVQGVSCLHATLLENQWWTTVKEDPSHTKDGTPACRGLVVCAVDMYNKASKQMLHLAVSALADFVKEVAASVYAHITSKIKALDDDGNYAPMSTLNIHQRHALAHLVMEHVTYEDGQLGFTFHDKTIHDKTTVRKSASRRKDRVHLKKRISQNTIERLEDVEFLLKELEFQNEGIPTKMSIFSDS